jgi:predicted metalloprotease with PDZ domain
MMAIPPGTVARSIRFPPPWLSVEASTDAETLLDSPILYGKNLRRWHFRVEDVNHEIVYWPLPNSTPFDTTQFVDGIEKVAREAVAVFGRPPYPYYQFLLEDGAYGALEHKNSVTIGMQSRDLARDPHEYLFEFAHEFFHAWNLVRLYPEGRGKLSVDHPAHSTGLWLSEGVTIYYAEALTRRAGFSKENMARKDLLARQLEIYYERPGNTHVSPEVASERAVDTTGINGDYEPNYYVQGRLIGTALDLILRDSTRGAKGLDDFMRAMYDRFAMKRGFTTDDVERTAHDVCGCNLHHFFEDHVRNARPLDFTPYLKTIGLSIRVDTIPGVDTAGKALPDTRIWAYPRAGDRRMRVWIQDPSGAWARAGLRTGQDLVAFNGVQVDSFPDWRRAIRTVTLGSDVPVDIMSDGKRQRIPVHVAGFQRPRVTIAVDQSASAAQIERRRQWEIAR